MNKYCCNNCHEYFESKKGCKSRIPKFCSTKCYAESLKINKPCKLCGKIINGNNGSVKNRIYCSKECQGKVRKGVLLSEVWKKALSEGRKKSNKCKGENLYNWKGGKSTQKIRMKTSFYKRRNALKKDMPINFLDKILIIQRKRCFFCESKLIEYKAIEHLTPISRGGDNDNFNLVYSCKSCNSKKRQNTLEEYAIKTKNFHWIEKWERNFINSL